MNKEKKRPSARNTKAYERMQKMKGELATLTEALKKRVSQLTVLYRMGRDISENENWSDALDRFLMAFVKYMQADGAALLLFSHNGSVLAPRANFQVDPVILEESCTTLLKNWETFPRPIEIHSLEAYRDKEPGTCLERSNPWRVSIIPLKHRSRALGFLILDKKYGSGKDFGIDYQFLNTIQTTFTEHVANASYISELRSLGRFNQKVLDNINSGVITTDLDGYVRFYNTRACDLCPELATAKNIHFNDLFSSDSYREEFFKHLMESPKDTHVLEVSGSDGTGSFFPARLSTSKMFDDMLNGLVLVAIFEDLTEQKLMEAEIRRNDRLRILGQLSAGVAHEIRNPLTGIATSVEVLESKLQGDGEKIKYIKAVLDEIHRLDGIIKNLLDFAKPAKPHFRDCYLPDVANRVMNLLSDHAKRRGISFKLINNLEDEVCRADADQLTQVLLNVVLNALQVCQEKDKVKMILSKETSRSEGDLARIEVIDSGPGIPEEVRDTLFEPFVTTKTKGTGMGLAISQQIVEEHGGRIHCEQLEKGTKFTITLPIKAGVSCSTSSKRSKSYAQNHTDHR